MIIIHRCEDVSAVITKQFGKVFEIGEMSVKFMSFIPARCYAEWFYAVAKCLPVSLSVFVYPSVTIRIASKRLNLSLRFFHRLIATTLWFSVNRVP